MKAINRIVDVVFLGILTTALALAILMMATGNVHASFTNVG